MHHAECPRRLMMNTAVRYAVEPTHVREVSLLGGASLTYWEQRLSTEDLIPAERGGNAQVLIIAAAMRFMGIRFTEVSFSVLLSGDGHARGQASAFLVQAFNSCRWFALSERLFFATPYEHGDCRVSISPSPSIQLIQNGQIVFRADMRADSAMSHRQQLRSGEDSWEGRVFLPKRRSGSGDAGRFFFARMKGHTRAYPFLGAADVLSIKRSRAAAIFQALLDSHFVGEEWVVREDATHGKSKTYRRPELARR